MARIALTLGNFAHPQPASLAPFASNSAAGSFTASLQGAFSYSGSERAESSSRSARASTRDHEAGERADVAIDDDEADDVDEAQGSSSEAQALPDEAHDVDDSDESNETEPDVGLSHGQADATGSSRDNRSQNDDTQRRPRQTPGDTIRHDRTVTERPPSADTADYVKHNDRGNENRPPESQGPIHLNIEADSEPRRAEPVLELRGQQRVDAAVARAAQIDTAIRLENATGQSAGDASARPTLALQGGAAITGNGVNNQGESASQLLNQSSQVDEERFASRVVRGLTTMINQRGGSMTMRLDPPELGQLRVQMTIHRGTVTAQFTASTAQAQALLEKNIATLRVSLENQGLTVDRLSVSTSQSASNQNQTMNDNNADRNQHHRHDAGGGQSRGRREQSARDDWEEEVRNFSGLVTSLHEQAEGEES